MNQIFRTKPYILGLSIGTCWLIASSAGFSIQMIAIAGTSNDRTAIAAVVGVAAALLTVTLRQIVAARRLPNELPTPAHRGLRRRFVWVVILELIGIVLVNSAFYSSGHMSLLVPFDLIIVGIHFFPLAKLFGVPRYTALGTSFCAISILTLLMVPADAHIGKAIARFLTSSVGCAVATWLTSVGNIAEVRRLLSRVARNAAR